MTKPRPRSAGAEDPKTRLATVKRMITTAQRRAQEIADDPSTHRSTRMHAARKHKAETLDRISEMLAGRQ